MDSITQESKGAAEIDFFVSRAGADKRHAANIARIRNLLAAQTPDTNSTDASDTADGPRVLALPCPCCGGRLIIVAALAPGDPYQQRPVPEGIDSS